MGMIKFISCYFSNVSTGAGVGQKACARLSFISCTRRQAFEMSRGNIVVDTCFLPLRK